jgi:hypothetical protein
MNEIFCQAFAERYHIGGNNLCQIATIPTDTILRLDGTSDGEIPFIMGGMSAKNFNPARYAGRWFEVASLKRGFAGQGQEDCHCTQVREGNSAFFSSNIITSSLCFS